MCTSNLPTDDEIIALLFLIAPQFKTDDPEKIAGYKALLAALRCQVNFAILGCCYVLALANLLAHTLTLQGNPLIGTSNSISEGQLSISSSFNINAIGYNSTSYGQAFDSLISKYKIGAYVASSRRRFYGPICGC